MILTSMPDLPPRPASAANTAFRWDGEARQWRQHWVDNQGGLLRLEGGLEGSRMVMSARQAHADKPGITLRQRIVWTPDADGSVRQRWERSEDDGRTWSTVFDGRYVKAK